MDEAQIAIDPNWQCAGQLHDPAYPADLDAWLATFAKVGVRFGGQGVLQTTIQGLPKHAGLTAKIATFCR